MFQNLIQKAYAENAFLGEGMPGTSSSGNYEELLKSIFVNIMNPLIALMIAFAVLYFLWGVFQFIRNAESPEERKKGGLHMLYGVVGLFLMVTAYGVVRLIVQTIRP